MYAYTSGNIINEPPNGPSCYSTICKNFTDKLLLEIDHMIKMGKMNKKDSKVQRFFLLKKKQLNSLHLLDMILHIRINDYM